MAHRDVCPENLRFTQDSIKNTFKKPYEYQRIDDAVDQIGNNQLSPAVLMPLHVVQHKSVMWSLDNRRLWVLRKAGVPTVKVILVPPKYNRRSEDFFFNLNDPLVRRYSSANYFPRVRGGVRSVTINHGNGRSGGAPPTSTPMPLHDPTPVAGAAQANKSTGIPPALPPHHFKTGTVRVDIPAQVNYEASSISFHKESQPPPIPLLLHHPTTVPGSAQVNRTIPRSTSTTPPPPPRHLKDVTVRINIPPLSPNSGAPPPPVPLLLHHPPTVPGSAQANTTLPKYTPGHLRDTTVRIDIHPLPNASHRLSGKIVPLLSNNSSDPSEDPLLLHHPTTVPGSAQVNMTIPRSTSTTPPPPPRHLKDVTVRINIPPLSPNSGAPPPPVPLLLHHPPTVPGSAQANTTLPKYTPGHLRDTPVRIDIHPLLPPLPNASHRLSGEIVPLLSNNSSDPSEDVEGSDLWGIILNFVRWVKNKVVDFFRVITCA